jgi:tetratricopeptide (TPR) repeat protein
MGTSDSCCCGGNVEYDALLQEIRAADEPKLLEILQKLDSATATDPQVNGLRAICLCGLYVIYTQQQRHPEADAAFERMIAIVMPNLPSQPAVARAMETLTPILLQKAADPRTRGNIYRHAEPELPRHLSRELDFWGRTLVERGQPDRAEPLFLEALSAAERDVDPQNSDVATAAADLADLYFRRDALDLALPMARRAVQLLEHNEMTVTGDYADMLYIMGAIAYSRGEHEQAAEKASRAATLYGASSPDAYAAKTEQAFTVQSYALYKLGRYHEACAAMEEAISAQERIPEVDDAARAKLLHELAECYEVAGRTEDAVRVRQRATSLLDGLNERA